MTLAIPNFAAVYTVDYRARMEVVATVPLVMLDWIFRCGIFSGLADEAVVG